MSHFERTEGAEDNLGNNSNFIPLEDLAVDPGLTPDEILMRREKREKRKEENEETNSDLEGENDVVSFEPDDEASNWEADVENGKYDLADDSSVSFHNRDRIKRTEVIERGDREEKRFFDDWEYANNVYSHHVKPKRPQDNKDSIRFGEEI